MNESLPPPLSFPNSLNDLTNFKNSTLEYNHPAIERILSVKTSEKILTVTFGHGCHYGIA